eukprot:6396774-Amphidinium_carterae.1
MAAVRVIGVFLNSTQMKLHSASALLSYTWLLVTLFGPCLPILNGLLALLVKIYYFLLFGSDLELLHMTRTQKHSIGVHNCLSICIALLALAMHSCNMPSLY